jgi:hypothetical protein
VQPAVKVNARWHPTGVRGDWNVREPEAPIGREVLAMRAASTAICFHCDYVKALSIRKRSSIERRRLIVDKPGTCTLSLYR